MRALLVFLSVTFVVASACNGDERRPDVTQRTQPEQTATATGSSAFVLQELDGASADVSFAGIDRAVDLSGGATEFKRGEESGEGSSASIALAAAVSRDLPVRDIAARPFGDWFGWAIQLSGKYIAYRLAAPRATTRPDMSIEAYSRSLGPGRVVTGRVSTSDANVIEHMPAEAVRVSGHEGYYLGQRAPVSANATCKLAWFDGTTYFVLAWPCKGLNPIGRDRDGLIELAQQGLSLYDEKTQQFTRQ